MRIARLRVYPIKSCGGIEVPCADVDIDGLALDHRFALVGNDGKVITMREYPELALVRVIFGRNQNTLEVHIPGIAALPLYFDGEIAAPRRMQIHDDRCVGFDVPGALSVAFSHYLGASVHVVRYAPKRHQRMHGSTSLGRQIPCNFADGYPVLVTTTGSADFFEVRSGTSSAIERFRPQIVIDCGDAEAENEWKSIATETVRFEFAKRCQRCQIPLVDPGTGDKSLQVMRTGMRHYTIPDSTGWYFASNYVPSNAGSISVGQEVRIIR